MRACICVSEIARLCRSPLYRGSGANGGVVCHVNTGEVGAVPADLHVDVIYYMRWSICSGQGKGDYNL